MNRKKIISDGELNTISEITYCIAMQENFTQQSKLEIWKSLKNNNLLQQYGIELENTWSELIIDVWVNL